MRGLPQKQNARRADKIRLCGHLGRYKKIVKKTYIILYKLPIIQVNLLHPPTSVNCHQDIILHIPKAHPQPMK